MKGPSEIYIVKGNIRAYNYCGVHKLLRKGALHYLPLEPFTIYDERRFKEFALCDNRISIRAKHKSGLFRVKRIHIRFLENLHIEKIENPSEASLNYLEENKILYYELNSWKHQHMEEVLSHMEKYNFLDPTDLVINDPLYIAARDYVQALKTKIRANNLESILNKDIKYPVRIIGNTNNKKQRLEFSLEEMKINLDLLFNDRVKALILNTDLNSIYPCGKVLILGNLSFEISKDFEFRINSIQKLKEV